MFSKEAFVASRPSLLYEAGGKIPVIFTYTHLVVSPEASTLFSLLKHFYVNFELRPSLRRPCNLL